MSIANEITNYANGLSDAYDAVNDMQGIIPTDKNMNNLDTAIRTIPQSQGSTYTAGDGIDITNDVISATNTGKAKALTTDDYNWNSVSGDDTTLPFDCVAIWKLPEGFYTNANGVNFKRSKAININTDPGYAWIIGTPYNNSRRVIEWSYATENTVNIWRISLTGTGSDQSRVLLQETVVNNLTTNSTNTPLSAAQGKTLKDLVDSLITKAAGAPTASTAGTVGKLYEDTTNGKLYICTDATNPYVWEEVGAGGATYTAGNGISIDANNEISIDDTVVAEVSDLPTDFTGATSSTAGTNGLVPAPSAGDEDKVLKGDGTWATVSGGLTNTTVYIDLVGLDYNNAALYHDYAKTQQVTEQEWFSIVADTSTNLYLWCIGGDETILATYEYRSDGIVVFVQDSAYSLEIQPKRNNTDYFVVREIISQEKLTAGSNITISGDTISATDTTYSNFTGATSSTAGANGLVPAPAAGDEGKALHGDGTWKDTTAKLVEMSYGESGAWAKFIAAYNAGSIVYCRASSNANPGTGSQTRKAFMAYVNNATSPTSVEFQYVRSVSSKSASQPVDQVFVYTLTNSNGGTWSVATRDMAPKLAAGTNTSVSYASGTYTVSANVPVLNYSTSEVDTGTTWIDGSHIYKKTINFGALPNATTKTVAHGISNLGRVVKFECLAYNPTSGNNTPIPLVSVVGNNSTMDIDSTNIVMNTGVDRSPFTECYVTLYYTKSS